MPPSPSLSAFITNKRYLIVTTEQRPDNQGEDAQDVIGWDRQPMRLVETFPQRIQGAGSDVAIHHSHGGDGK